MIYKNYVELYALRFAWWNVALSSTAVSNKNSIDKDYISIIESLLYLFTSQRLALLGLCEISSDDVSALKVLLPANSKIKIMDLNERAGRTRFDTAIIYDCSVISIDQVKGLSIPSQGQTIKIAQRLVVYEREYNERFYVYLSHWPSQILGIGDDKRKRAAIQLYENAKELLDRNERVILMGDFNENPHSPTLSILLNASRCHNKSRNYPTEVLYNPFWRSIVSKLTYSYVTPKDLKFQSGSLFYKNNFEAEWHSFDQIIVSGNFLGSGSWHLQESMTGVIDAERYLNYIYDNESNFDHLPVVCEVTRPEV
ncbi:endonuclease/exonuclease/phosphatase family protein [Vibrio fluvialis]